MSETPLAEPDAPLGEVEQPAPPVPSSLPRVMLRRILTRGYCWCGCGLWLVLLLMPCALVTLLVENEIVVPRSDLPEHEFRLFFLDGADERGFGLARGSVVKGGEEAGAVCVRTQVDYLLWEGEASGADYCNCYEAIEGTWVPTLVGGNARCEPLPVAE
ncbi:MAG: hypothetical protein HC915_14625 [Anaerolineae bacterium]|nr:hypothetical protein [Anaerolineae bacterium]